MPLINHQALNRWILAARHNQRADYFFPIPAQGKERPGEFFSTKPSTRAFEALIAEATREQVEEKLLTLPLGCVILATVPKRTFDIDNFLKSLWDGMNNLAYDDDKMFDMVFLVRELSPDVSISVEIIQG